MSFLSASNLVAIYSVFIGFFMIGFWLVAILKSQVPPSEKPWAITFHLLAEFSTAILLVVSGAELWLGGEWAKMISFTSLGMLLYAVVNSPGYYAQKHNLPMVAMFIVLTILTIAAIITLFLFI